MVLWKARHAAIKIGTATPTVLTTQVLYDQVGGATQYEDIAENVEISLPEGASNDVMLLGEDSDGYQNQELDKERRGKGSVTMDIIAGNKDIIQWMVTPTTTTSGASGYTRYNLGDEDSSVPGIAIQLTDGTDTQNFLLNNANCINAGNLRAESTGHIKRSGVKFECLARDFYMEKDLAN